MSLVPTITSDNNSYQRLRTTLLSRVSGLSDDALAIELGNAMQHFLQMTHVWRETVEVNLIAGQTRYKVSPRASQYAQVNYIINVEADERPLRPLGGDFISRGTWGHYKVEDSFDEIELSTAPTTTKAQGLKVVVGLTLKPDKLDMPRELIDRYFEALIAGTQARLYETPNKPYTNLDEAKRCRREFLADVSRTRRAVNAGNVKGSPPWAFNRQAPGRSRRGSRSYGF